MMVGFCGRAPSLVLVFELSQNCIIGRARLSQNWGQKSTAHSFTLSSKRIPMFATNDSPLYGPHIASSSLKINVLYVSEQHSRVAVTHV
jgi:hypothetical protein